MNRLIVIALCALGLVLIMRAGGEIGGPSVESRVAAAHARNDAPPIWVASDKDSTLYLFGTVHLLPGDMIWQKDDMKTVFDGAGTIFFEVDTGSDAQLEAAELTQKMGFISNGQRLSDDLDVYQNTLLDSTARSGGIDLALLDSMKPWLASELLTVAAAGRAGLSPDLAADEALKNRARLRRKNVIYLDTIESQIRASADQPKPVQLLLLSETLSSFANLDKELTFIANRWAVGDTKSLQPKTVDILQQRSPELYHSLLVERNRKWTKEFVKFLNENGSGFAAIGISHLLGDDSIQEMLRNNGYTVSRYYAFQGKKVIKSVYEVD